MQGLSAVTNEEVLNVDSLPSFEWIDFALTNGHLYLPQALDTLNDLLKLGLDERIRLAGLV